MRFLEAFGRFWWDFVVGDDWKIAAGVATVLIAAAVVVSSVGGGGALVAPLVGVALIAAFVVAVAVDVRRR
ncbi:MAG TPA: hypothetical protein VFU51_01715 [Gaiellaceae bacterium]|nr:hypothetical protein [Gaiellaceae bacterium]